MTGPLPPAPAHPRRLVYFGTPRMAVPTLEALVAAGFDVALVVTRIDKRRGRGNDLMPSPVKASAARLGLPVSHRVDDATEVGADLGVVVAFGQLIARPVLEQLPMVNLHFSLLPRWRGAAPVERAILAGDTHTGVGVMRVEEGLDTGGLYAQAVVAVDDRSAAELRDELTTVGTALLLGALRQGLAEPVPQVGEPLYARKIDSAELQIDWTRSAVEIARLVRLGMAWTTFRGRRLKVLDAVVASTDVGRSPGRVLERSVATGEGSLDLVVVQPEGKAAMAAQAWINGARPGPEDRLGG